MRATTEHPHCEHCDLYREDHERGGDGLLFCHYRHLGVSPDRYPGGVGRPSFRRRVEDMPRLGGAPHPSVPIGEYADCRGGSCVVIGGCLDDDTQEVRILYVSVEHGYVGPARTVAEWQAVVDWPDGSKGPRFKGMKEKP